jgi:hypothetical protein
VVLQVLPEFRGNVSRRIAVDMFIPDLNRDSAAKEFFKQFW